MELGVTERNARIASTHLGPEDHGILTCWLHLDFGSSGQGFGGYALDYKPLERKAGSGRRPSDECGRWVAEILRVVGVEKWEDLKGKHIRARSDGGKIIAIGHIVEDRWFAPGVLARAPR